MSKVQGKRVEEGYEVRIDKTLMSGETVYVEWHINGDDVWADISVQKSLLHSETRKPRATKPEAF